MPANYDNKRHDKEEVDLLYLFAKFGEFIVKIARGLFNVLISIIFYIVRKWYFLAFAFVLTVLSSLILKNSVTEYYYSHIVLKTNTGDNQGSMSYLNRLGDYARKKNFGALSSELDIPIADASSIIGVDTYWYFDIGKDEIIDGIDYAGSFISDTNVAKVDNKFVLRVKVTDPLVLNNLDEKLVSYMNANKFLKSSNNHRLSELKELLEQTDYEISKLDSLQKKEYYSNAKDNQIKEGQFIFSTEKDVVLYHNDVLNLLKAKQRYIRELDIQKDVISILEGFSVPNKRDNGLLYYFKKLIWYYLVFFGVLSLFITFRKTIWERKYS